MRQLFLYILCLTLTACAASSRKADPTLAPLPPIKQETVKSAPAAEPEERVDVEALRRALKLQPHDLGYHEKRFNTCEVGYGFSPNRNCRRLAMAVIRFRLQCRLRESDGQRTIQAHEIVPIGSSDLKWSLGSVSGTTQTDGEGHGEITAIAPLGARSSRFKLTLNGKFLVLSAGSVSRVVAPPDWCQR